MATETVIQQSKNDREGAVHEAAALGDLVMWVSQARDLLSEIRAAAGYESSPLRRELERFNIPYNTADWTGVDAGEGLSYLLQRQNELIKSRPDPICPLSTPGGG